MQSPASRYPQSVSMTLRQGWHARRLIGPSPLHGSNGLRFGGDGRLYIAEALGSRITAWDLAEGNLFTISPQGSAIVAPDDLAFDSKGNLYITEVQNGRLTRLTPDGRTEVVYTGLHEVNGITIYKDRIFVDECRSGGRVMELYADGRSPRVLASDFPLPNALAVGPDQQLYFPVIGDNAIWRIALDGGSSSRVFTNLNMPTAVKFDKQGSLYCTEARSGDLLKMDITTGQQQRVASLDPGLDNLEIADNGTVYVSSFIAGGVISVAVDGARTTVIPHGLLGPYGIAIDDGGTLYAAEGFSVAAVTPDGEVHRVIQLMDHNYPGFVTGIAAFGDGQLTMTTAQGKVISFNLGNRESMIRADNLDELHDIALTASGDIIVAEGGAGRILRISGETISVIASGLIRPMGVCVDENGEIYVTDEGAGQVLHLRENGIHVLATLKKPQGIVCVGRDLLVADVETRNIVSVSLKDLRQSVICAGTPVGAPPGVAPKILPGNPGLLGGPLTPFCGLATDSAGIIYLSANGEGSIIALSSVKPKNLD